MTIEIEVEDTGTDALADVVEDVLETLEEIVEDNAETVDELAETIEELAETVEELVEEIEEVQEDSTPADTLIAIGERLAHMESRIDQIEVSRMDEIIEEAQPVDEPTDEPNIIVADETPTNWRTKVNDWWFGRS